MGQSFKLMGLWGPFLLKPPHSLKKIDNDRMTMEVRFWKKGVTTLLRRIMAFMVELFYKKRFECTRQKMIWCLCSGMGWKHVMLTFKEVTYIENIKGFMVHDEAGEVGRGQATLALLSWELATQLSYGASTRDKQSELLPFWIYYGALTGAHFPWVNNSQPQTECTQIFSVGLGNYQTKGSFNSNTGSEPWWPGQSVLRTFVAIWASFPV